MDMLLHEPPLPFDLLVEGRFFVAACQRGGGGVHGKEVGRRGRQEPGRISARHVDVLVVAVGGRLAGPCSELGGGVIGVQRRRHGVGGSGTSRAVDTVGGAGLEGRLPLLGLLVGFPGLGAGSGGLVLDLLIGDGLGDDVFEELEVVVVIHGGCWRCQSGGTRKRGGEKGKGGMGT